MCESDFSIFDCRVNFGGYIVYCYSPKYVRWLLLGLYSPSGRTSYRKISRSLEAARFGFKLFQVLWNWTGTSTTVLPRCLSNFRAMRSLKHPISRLRDFARLGGKTSYRLVNRGPVFLAMSVWQLWLPNFKLWAPCWFGRSHFLNPIGDKVSNRKWKTIYVFSYYVWTPI